MFFYFIMGDFAEGVEYQKSYSELQSQMNSLKFVEGCPDSSAYLEPFRKAQGNHIILVQLAKKHDYHENDASLRFIGNRLNDLSGIIDES